MLTKEQQRILLQDAARLSGLDSNVRDGSLQTLAEEAMVALGGSKKTPRKNSYLWCDSVDACFYYQQDKACVTFTAKWYPGSKDLDEAKMQNAIGHIKAMLDNMEMLAEAVLKGVDDGKV